MKRTSRNIIITISIFIISTIIFSNYSYASSNNEFKSFNNAPRKTFTVSSDKLADVTITIKDNNGISSVKLYSVDSEGNNEKEINFSTSNTKDSKNHIYTLSHTNLLKGKTKCFYIKIKDESGNVHYSGFRVCVRTKTVNNKTIQYYAIDDSPRVQNWSVIGSKVSFIVKDSGGIKYAKVQDANNDNKEIYKFENLAKGENKVTIDMNKFKTSSGIYKLRIVTEDNNKQQAIRKVYFTLNSTKILFVGNSKTYVNDIPGKFKKLAEEGGYRVSVTTATQGGKTLEYLASKYKSTINKYYDIVILQEASDTYQNNYKGFLSGANSISKMVKAKNPNVKLFVRQTWILKDSTSTEKSQAYQNARKVAANIGASLIYDGKAMYKLDKNVVFKDKRHQTPEGAYLAACCIYNAVFKKTPVGLSYKADLSSSTAKELQQLANTIYKAETK